MLRRLVALLLMLCLGLFSAEALLAEAHDDGVPDSSAGAVNARTSAPAGPSPLDCASVEVSVAAALTSPAGVFGVSTAASSVMAEHLPSAPSVPGGGVPSGDGQALHLCHCLHGHGLWTPLPDATFRELVVAGASGLPGKDLAPASAHTQPGLRPPID